MGWYICKLNTFVKLIKHKTMKKTILFSVAMFCIAFSGKAQLKYEKDFYNPNGFLTFNGPPHVNFGSYYATTTWYGGHHVWTNGIYGGNFHIMFPGGTETWLSGGDNVINFMSPMGTWNTIQAGRISVYGDIYSTGDLTIKNIKVGTSSGGGTGSIKALSITSNYFTGGNYDTSNGSYTTTKGSYYTTYGGFYVLSDIAAKTNIAPVRNATQTVLALKPVTFRWIDTEHLQYKKPSPLATNPQEIGFISQEIEQVLPNLISIDDDGQKFMNYQALIPLLTGAIQELNTRIEVLERQLNAK